MRRNLDQNKEVDHLRRRVAMTGVDASEGEDDGRSFVLNGPSVVCVVDESHVHNYCTVHDLVLDLSYPVVPTTSSASKWMLVTMVETGPQLAGAVAPTDGEGKGYHAVLVALDKDQDGAVPRGTHHSDWDWDHKSARLDLKHTQVQTPVM